MPLRLSIFTISNTCGFLINSLISSDEILLQVIRPFNWDEKDFLLYINDTDTKEKLINNTQELMDRGGFGSPTFFIDETNMFFGNDRIQLIKELL